jgi:tetratricopeptide (TPR) repeat protein
MNEVSPEAGYLYRQARQKVENGEYQNAVEILTRVTEICPTHSQAYNELGICHDCSNMYEDALAYYDKAIQADPFHADAWFNKGMSLKKLGREKEAQQSIEKAIDLYVGR